MNTLVQKKVEGLPIENLLKNNGALPVDSQTLHESLERLQALRQAYMSAPQSGNHVFKLPSLQK